MNMARLLGKQWVRDMLLGLGLLCATLALMLYPQESMQAARDGLTLCGNVIIPSPVSYTHLTLPTICSV